MLAETREPVLEARASNPDEVEEPLCDREEYEQLVEEMVADEAPRLFAVVQDYGNRVDSRIAAWGMAFDDRVEIVGVDSDVHWSAASPTLALRAYGRRKQVTARVVWVNPDAATSPDDEAA